VLIGPIFTREAVIAPRRPRHFVQRAVYISALIILMCTAWLLVAGTQTIRNIGDMARFGSILFQILAPVQLALVTFLSALLAASGVSQEKDKRTLLLLLMTRMNNSELVLGKLFASLLNIFFMVVAALPVMLAIILLGGVSVGQVLRVFLVTLSTSLLAGSLGVLFAFWREKTFQTLALTAMVLVLWQGCWLVVGSGALGENLLGVHHASWARAFSPISAVIVASQPAFDTHSGFLPGWLGNAGLFVVASTGLIVFVNTVAIFKVRVWNPSRELRQVGQAAGEDVSIWGDRDVEEDVDDQVAERSRGQHVDGRTRDVPQAYRKVWDNPILWREVCTWAYGRKVMIIRIGYLLTAALVGLAIHSWLGAEVLGAGSLVPAAAKPLAPFFIVSLVIVNALAVTSITNERDGQSLDLLLVTDLTPKELVLGKLFGVFWVTKEMIIVPLLMVGYLLFLGAVNVEQWAFVSLGLLVMNVFVTMLGLHCGITYSNSRSAIGVSLGTVFFLFLGVVTCVTMMVSFSNSFQTQLAPFLAFILGGSVGLYVTLGIRNPSSAILLASLLLPFATFHAITSFLLGHSLSVFLVSVVTYGFTTAAMMVPAIGEFDIAMGRTKTAMDE
jgi:ABC-type transport system involved in multi-copper enzyme maturation permease subunit